MSVELSFQLQIDSIAAVQNAFTNAIVGRGVDTLWWLVDYSGNIIYENRIKGSDILAVDQAVRNVSIGSSIFSPWFALHNSYFQSDQPFVGVTTIKQAIETKYLWRVSQYFNDVMASGNAESIHPQYVFPYPNFNLGTYAATGGTTGTWTKGVGPVDQTLTGPGVIGFTPAAPIGANGLTLSVTGVFPDLSTVNLSVTVPNGTTADTTVPVGGQALTASHTGATGNGIVAVGSTAAFRAGQLVLLQENQTGTTPFLWVTEVAEVASISDSTHLVLRQPTPPGATAPFANGLRNNYTTSAHVYPLFVDVSNITNSVGDSGDTVHAGFYPDRPQGFLDISSISTVQGG